MISASRSPITFYYSADSDDAFRTMGIKKENQSKTVLLSFNIKTGNTEDLNRSALSGADIRVLSSMDA